MKRASENILTFFSRITLGIFLFMLLALMAAVPGAQDMPILSKAVAAEDGHGGGGPGSGGGYGGGGKAGGHGSTGGHDSGHDTGHDSGDDGHDSGKKGPRYMGGDEKGGHEAGEHEDTEHSDSGDHGEKGPSSGFTGGGKRHVPGGLEGGYGGQGQRGAGSGGGRPVWAQEGIPQTELGRLNVARSPDQVLQRAYDEVASNWTPELAAFYSQSAADAAQALSSNYDNVVRVDSPLQNLSMYKDLLADGQSALPGVNPVSINDSAAIMLGSASDKNIPVTDDTVKAMNLILGVGTSMTESQIADLAAKADSVRAAILAGHGE
jgi:hypothetical protein